MLRRKLPAFAALAAAFLVALGASTLLAGAVERWSAQDVRRVFLLEGIDFAEIETDGLQVVLTGTAATEAMRFRALTVAGQVVDSARIVDALEVADAAAIPAPRFGVEMLRNASGVSLIGLVPADQDREALIAALEEATGDPVSDLLQDADWPAPSGWDDALEFAVDAVGRLDRSKVSVASNRVAVTAAAASDLARTAAERALTADTPAGMRLSLAISAPRPVLTPFVLRFSLQDGEGRFGACSAGDEDQVDRITAAAEEAGHAGHVSCTLGLGAPSPRWGTAAALAIAAVGDLGGGQVALADAAVTLVAPEGTDQALFDRVIGRLQEDLPPIFELTAERPQPPDPDAPPAVAEVVATLSPEGEARVAGVLPDERARETVRSVAQARLGSGTDFAVRTADGLPGGWPLRVLAGIDALGLLDSGSLRITEDAIELTGLTGNASAREEIAALVAGRLGGEARLTLAVEYVETLDPEAGLPTPEECLARIRAANEARKITFAPGSADMEAGGIRTVAEIAEIVEGCPPLRLEVAGHTDSQGREEMNLDLSQRRAEAVVTALIERRATNADLFAQGYGETDPIADNDTADGREENRRIAFTLLAAEEDGDDEPAEDDAR